MLSEAPWIDYIVREGEEIIVNLVRMIGQGRESGEQEHHSVRGIAFVEDGKLVATQAHPHAARGADARLEPAGVVEVYLHR
ncbi:MAG: hypothetical protein U0Z44_04090 [Kouleothrix sp.]